MTPSQNGANSGTLTVVGPGSEPARIVVSAFAPSKVMEAAEFLQETIYDMTGTRLEIVDDTAVHTGNLSAIPAIPAGWVCPACRDIRRAKRCF